MAAILYWVMKYKMHFFLALPTIPSVPHSDPPVSSHSFTIFPSFSPYSIHSFADFHTLHFQHPHAHSCIITLPYSHYCSLPHQVHQHMVGFSRAQLQTRWRTINPAVSKGTFTVEEDFIMIKVRTVFIEDGTLIRAIWEMKCVLE